MKALSFLLSFGLLFWQIEAVSSSFFDDINFKANIRVKERSFENVEVINILKFSSEICGTGCVYLGAALRFDSNNKNEQNTEGKSQCDLNFLKEPEKQVERTYQTDQMISPNSTFYNSDIMLVTAYVRGLNSGQHYSFAILLTCSGTSVEHQLEYLSPTISLTTSVCGDGIMELGEFCDHHHVPFEDKKIIELEETEMETKKELFEVVQNNTAEKPEEADDDQESPSTFWFLESSNFSEDTSIGFMKGKFTTELSPSDVDAFKESDNFIDVLYLILGYAFSQYIFFLWMYTAYKEHCNAKSLTQLLLLKKMKLDEQEAEMDQEMEKAQRKKQELDARESDYQKNSENLVVDRNKFEREMETKLSEMNETLEAVREKTTMAIEIEEKQKKEFDEKNEQIESKQLELQKREEMIAQQKKEVQHIESEAMAIKKEMIEKELEFNKKRTTYETAIAEKTSEIEHKIKELENRQSLLNNQETLSKQYDEQREAAELALEEKEKIFAERKEKRDNQLREIREKEQKLESREVEFFELKKTIQELTSENHKMKAENDDLRKEIAVVDKKFDKMLENENKRLKDAFKLFDFGNITHVHDKENMISNL